MKPFFNRYLKFGLILLFVALAECCKSPKQTLKEKTVTENTTIEDLDDTTTVITNTVVVSIPTDSGGTKVTTHENKKIIKHSKKRGQNYSQVSKDEQKTDGLTPVLEREKTKRIKSDNKTKAKIAKEERKAQQGTYFQSLAKRLIAYAIVATLLYFWIKRK